MNAPGTPLNNSRYAALVNWLQPLAPIYQFDLSTMSSASSDASFRHYYRLKAGNSSFIAMDAPPQQENNPVFIRITDLLKQTGLNVPAIYEYDLNQGFLLLQDLGEKTYYQAIIQALPDAELQRHYRHAIQTLVHMQQAPLTNLPVYDSQRLLDELKLFNEWYVEKHCKFTLNDTEKAVLAQTFQQLVKHNQAAATVFVHRDFHSPNLIINTQDPQSPGVIDYQDALAGPITYDIASLVMDARTYWEEPQQLDWAIRYWEAARQAKLAIDADFADFHIAYEWMSLQRNLRILGVFARLSHRDNKHHYLDHLPHVRRYIRQVAQRYSVFLPLLRLLDKIENVNLQTGFSF